MENLTFPFLPIAIWR